MNNPYAYPAQTTANFQINSCSNRFLAWVQEGRIMADSPGGPRPVGVILETYQELETTAAGYRDRLAELGEIEIPLTQEQINEKLLAELREERTARNRLMALLEDLTGPLGQEVRNGAEKSADGGGGRSAAGHAEPAAGE